MYFWFQKKQYIGIKKSPFWQHFSANKLNSDYYFKIAQMVQDKTEIQIIKANKVRITSNTDKFIKGMTKEIFYVLQD